MQFKDNIMSYEETMNYIHNANKFGSKLGLINMEKALEKLGNPEKGIKFVHIAGTNGKGSTTKMLSNIFTASGYKTGMYVSPFVIDFEERIQINNVNISKEKLCYIVSQVREVSLTLEKEGERQLTEFEIITCIMFVYFKEEKVDIAFVEVGLGGRLDATNVIKPLLTIITSISFDHMNILGDSLYKIAYEKAGIVKENIPLVLYPQEKEAYDSIKKVCEEKNAAIIGVKKQDSKFIKLRNNNGKLIQEVEIYIDGEIYRLNLSLLGKHQILNASVVLNACIELKKLGFNLDKQDIYEALKNTVWQGRFQLINISPRILLDGAHNIDAINMLKENLDNYIQYKNLIIIFGVSDGKELRKMSEVITKDAKEVLLVTPTFKGGDIYKMLPVVKEHNENTKAYISQKDALSYAKSIYEDGDLILICGSLYLISDMSKLL